MKKKDYKRVAEQIKCSDEFCSKMEKMLSSEASVSSVYEDADMNIFEDTVTDVERARPDKIRYLGISLAACAVIGVSVGAAYTVINNKPEHLLFASSIDLSSVSDDDASTGDSDIYQEVVVDLFESIDREADPEEMNELFSSFANFENDLFTFNYYEELGQLTRTYTVRAPKDSYTGFVEKLNKVKWGIAEIGENEIISNNLYGGRFCRLDGALLLSECIIKESQPDPGRLYYVPIDEENKALYEQALAELEVLLQNDKMALMLDSIKFGGMNYENITGDISFERTIKENLNDDENNLISVKHDYSGKLYANSGLIFSDYIIQAQGQKKAVGSATLFDVDLEFRYNSSSQVFIESGDELDMFYGGIGVYYINNTQTRYIVNDTDNPVACPIDYYMLSKTLSQFVDSLAEREDSEYFSHHSYTEKTENGATVYEYYLFSDSDVNAQSPEWEVRVKLDERGSILYYEQKENGIIVDKIEVTNIVYDSPDFEIPDVPKEYNLFMCYDSRTLAKNEDNLLLTYFQNEEYKKKTTENHIRSDVEKAKTIKNVLAEYTPVNSVEHICQYGYYRMGFFENSVYDEYIIYLEDTPEFNLRHGDSYYMLSEEDIEIFRNLCISSFGKMGETDQTLLREDYIDYFKY